MKRLLFSAIAVSVISAGQASADIAIFLTQTGADGVTIKITGSGTVSTDSASNPGAILNLDNFTGTPFGGTLNTSDTNFNLVSDLTISGTDASNGFASYTSTIDEIGLNAGSGSGGADINLRGDFGIGVGDTYLASGESFVTGLSFSNLTPGVYTSTGFEADQYGGVTLYINVPEPSSMAPLAVMGLLLARRRRRR